MGAFGEGQLTKGLHGRLGGSGLSQMSVGDKASGATRGPNLLTVPIDATWSTTGSPAPTVDASGAHFVGAANLATAFHAITIESDAAYEIIWTLANLTLGSAKLLLYSAALNKLGVGTQRSANGTYTEVVNTNAAGSSTNRITVQATGTGTNNTYDVTITSIKKILGN